MTDSQFNGQTRSVPLLSRDKWRGHRIWSWKYKVLNLYFMPFHFKYNFIRTISYHLIQSKTLEGVGIPSSKSTTKRHRHDWKYRGLTTRCTGCIRVAYRRKRYKSWVTGSTCTVSSVSRSDFRSHSDHQMWHHNGYFIKSKFWWLKNKNIQKTLLGEVQNWPIIIFSWINGNKQFLLFRVFFLSTQ